MAEPLPHRLFDAERFRRIVRQARATHPFYRRWIPDENNVPLLTRRDLQTHNEEILNGLPANTRTSGSTGTPVRLHHTPERRRLNQPAIDLFLRHLGGPLPHLTIVDPHVPGRAADVVPVLTPIPDQLALIREHHVRAGVVSLITYPSNALLLADAIREGGLDFAFVRRLGLISESVDDGQLAILRRAFPEARIWSNYSAMEVGLISFACPYEPGFHHAAAGKLGIEILDDAGRPCPLGQVGRVVITDYFNRATPLIRYEIGDLAAPAECPCGRISLPALRNILGKVRGCLLHRDGRRFPFIDLSRTIRDLPGVRQYQVVQDAVDAFTVRLVADRPPTALIEAAFARAFGYPCRITIESLSDIPRDPNGKFHFAICRVPER